MAKEKPSHTSLIAPTIGASACGGAFFSLRTSPLSSPVYCDHGSRRATAPHSLAASFCTASLLPLPPRSGASASGSSTFASVAAVKSQPRPSTAARARASARARRCS